MFCISEGFSWLQTLTVRLLKGVHDLARCCTNKSIVWWNSQSTLVVFCGLLGLFMLLSSPVLYFILEHTRLFNEPNCWFTPKLPALSDRCVIISAQRWLSFIPWHVSGIFIEIYIEIQHLESTPNIWSMYLSWSKQTVLGHETAHQLTVLVILSHWK